MVAVGQQATAIVPQGGEAALRSGEKVNPKRLFVERDLQLPGALADVGGASLKPRQPEFGVHPAQHLGHRPGDKGVPFIKVVEQPPGRHDVAPANERHGRIQELQGQRQPEIV